MITVKNINKSHGQGPAIVKALKDVTMTITSGETVSVMGPSGCGKTTLLQVLSGIDHMDSGEVWFNETPLHLMNDTEVSKFRLNHMGFIFQSYHLVPVLTAVENTMLPLIARGMSRKEATIQAMSSLKLVGIEDKYDRYPSQLSGGQNQRVAIARAIIGKPQIIWADEPTGALDTETSEQITGLLLMLNKTLGSTVVIVTHDPKVAHSTSRTIYMESGRIVHDRNKDFMGEIQK
jgi:putative ABC transport system ATP-binding protein